MHTKTVFIPNTFVALVLACTFERNHPHDGSTVVAVVVDSPHAEVKDLCNSFASNGGWWLE